jgi:hypothetical protein
MGKILNLTATTTDTPALEEMPPKKGVMATIENMIATVEERPFDTYILAPFLIWYGLRSKKMNKWPRRLLVTAGIYQLFYKWKDYKKAFMAMKDPQSFKLHLAQIYEKYDIV